MVGEQFKDKRSVVRLWVHECERVLSDRLINDNDMAKFCELRINTTRKFFGDIPQVTIISLPSSLLVYPIVLCIFVMFCPNLEWY